MPEAVEDWVSHGKRAIDLCTPADWLGPEFIDVVARKLGDNEARNEVDGEWKEEDNRDD